MDDEFEQLVQAVAQHLIDNSKSIDPEFAKIMHDKFWDLIEKETSNGTNETKAAGQRHCESIGAEGHHGQL